MRAELRRSRRRGLGVWLADAPRFGWQLCGRGGVPEAVPLLPQLLQVPARSRRPPGSHRFFSRTAGIPLRAQLRPHLSRSLESTLPAAPSVAARAAGGSCKAWAGCAGVPPCSSGWATVGVSRCCLSGAGTFSCLMAAGSSGCLGTAGSAGATTCRACPVCLRNG